MKDNIDLTIDTNLTRSIITDFIRSEIQRAGLKRAVMGLSGGLDSALACFLTAEALGPENVLAIRLPYKTSSQDSLDDAQAVIDKTGVQSITIPISPMADALINQFPDMDAIRKGNIMARMRMVVWYDQSAAFKGLVIGTGNKTEILLGYTTLYGDSGVALVPLGDLYKTQVRQLSAAVGVPEQIIQKPPSADLWKGQTDEGELGFTYSEVDKLLYLLVDEHYSLEKCIESGFDEKFVKNVIERVRRNQFKRIMPPVARLNTRTTDFDSSIHHDFGV